MSFFVALFNYIRFAREVIWQMCVGSQAVWSARAVVGSRLMSQMRAHWHCLFHRPTQGRERSMGAKRGCQDPVGGHANGRSTVFNIRSASIRRPYRRDEFCARLQGEIH
jgi:hypothetical protein